MNVKDLSKQQLADAVYQLMTIESVVDGMCQIGPPEEFASKLNMFTPKLTLTLGELLSEAQRRNG